MSDSLTYLSGITLLFMSFEGYGEYENRKFFIKTAFEMAKRLRLFSLLNSINDLSSLSDDYRRATAHSARNIFNTVT